MTDTGFSSRPKDYAPVGKALHWITALIVLGMIPAGIVMTNIGESALQNRLFDLHRSFGVVVFALALWRVVVRLYHGAPAPYAGLTKFERIASAATHHTPPPAPPPPRLARTRANARLHHHSDIAM